MGPLVIFGLIEGNGRVWKETRVCMRDGVIGGDVKIPGDIMDYMLDAARQLYELTGDLSAPQQAKISTTMRESLERASESDSMRAMAHDVEMFGESAFTEHSRTSTPEEPGDRGSNRQRDK
jgi:hypothetical protein